MKKYLLIWDKKLQQMFHLYINDGFWNDKAITPQDIKDRLLERSNIDLDGTIPISSGWNTVKIAPSSPITCTKAQFRLDLDTADPNVYINDVSIEYRIIKKKAS